MAKRILITDDSALVRKQLGDLIASAGYEVEYAKNGQEAVDKALAEDFNAITMDINMPVKDGITAVREIMAANPTPILMISSLTTEEADVTFEALDLGAIDYVAKPGTFNLDLANNSEDILQKLTVAARMTKSRLKNRLSSTTKVVRTEKKVVSGDTKFSKVLLIGASTGGPGLIEEICKSLPANYPYPVCVVQHMPERFSASFATRLNRSSELTVKESQDGEDLKTGHIYVAKGGIQLNFVKKVSGKIVLKHAPNTHGRFFTPSVDDMMLSAVSIFGARNLIGTLLTGIGDDGAEGMVAIKQGGGYTIAENESTAYVYGMPKEAIERGGAVDALAFPDIIKKLTIYR